MMFASAPQPLDHPIETFIARWPWGLFLAIHIVLFVVAAFLAWRAYESRERMFGTGFTLFALAEIVYMLYHVNITVFLLSHTVSEVLDTLGFVALFAGAVQHGLVSLTPARSHAPRVGGAQSVSASS